jgi:xylulokinase
VDLYLGVDVGTTACKAGLYDAAGSLIYEARSAGYPVHRPRMSWAEQDADDWWRAARTCLAEAAAAVPAGARVAAVGLAGAWGQLFVGADGRPTGPALIWQDGRAETEAAELSDVDADSWREWLGAELPRGAATPPPRLRWLRRHRPEMLGPGVRMLQAKDWVAYQLTGEVGTDVTSTMWLVNQRTGTFDARYAQFLGVDPSLIPATYRPYQVIGEVTATASEATGLAARTPVVAGWIDTWAGILGTGLGLDGCAFDLAGTSEAVGIAGAPPHTAPTGLLDVPLDEHTDVVYGLTNAGADSFRWAAEALYGERAVEAAYPVMEAHAATARAGVDGLIFLPYLTGERSPVWDPAVRATFVGIDRAHRRAHLARAVYEGLAFCVRQLLDTAVEATGATCRALRTSGGGAESALANQIKADVTGIPVQTVAVPDAGTLGAAMLAAIGAGRYPDYPAAIAAMLRLGRMYEPDPAQHDALGDAYQTYRGLYAAIAAHSQVPQAAGGRVRPAPEEDE